jgi:hypothetical protein
MHETLMKLSSDMKTVYEMLETETDKQLINDTLEALEGDFSYKLEGCACVYDRIKAECESAQKKANAWNDISKTLENNMIRLNDYMKMCMENAGIKEIETDMHRFKIVKNGGKLPLRIDGGVPENFIKTEVKQLPDKDKIREALENGEVLTFASLGERGTHLKID